MDHHKGCFYKHEPPVYGIISFCPTLGDLNQKLRRNPVFHILKKEFLIKLLLSLRTDYHGSFYPAFKKRKK